jgi:Domain of unknown function (DUF4271)
MIRIGFLLLSLAGSFHLTSYAQVLTKNYQAHWMVQSDQGYTPYTGQNVSTISFEIDTRSTSRQYLQVKGHRPFAIFLNKKLLGTYSSGEMNISLDSLRNAFGAVLWVSIYQREGVQSLSTLLIDHSREDDLARFPRSGTAFSDFCTLCAILLLIAFVALFRASPRLALDYFNFLRLFSWQDRESNLLAGRLTTSINIFYFLFTSAFASLISIVLARFIPSQMTLSHELSFTSMGGGFVAWLVLTAVIFLILMLRLILVNVIGSLFNIPEANLQFFQLVRTLLLNVVIWSLIGTFYVIFQRGTIAFSYAPGIITGIFVLVIGVMFIKLMNRGSFTISYLFFYLCLTEIVPLMILSTWYFE